MFLVVQLFTKLGLSGTIVETSLSAHRCFASSVFVFVDTDAHLADDLSSRRGMLGSGEGILIRLVGAFLDFLAAG